MLDFLLDHFQGSPLALGGLFFVLIGCGLGVPLPEDIVLIAAGIITEDNGKSWILTSIVMWFGVMAGDSITFMIGRHFGMPLLASRWGKRIFSPRRQQKTKIALERYGTAVLFIARFLPGVRAPAFCTAGAMHVPYLKFLLLDGCAALISVPVFVWLGSWLWRRFHDDIEKMTQTLTRTHSYSLWVTIGLVVVVVAVVVISRNIRARSRP